MLTYSHFWLPIASLAVCNPRALLASAVCEDGGTVNTCRHDNVRVQGTSLVQQDSRGFRTVRRHDPRDYTSTGVADHEALGVDWFNGFHAGESTYDEDVIDDNRELLEQGASVDVKANEGTTPRLPILGFQPALSSNWFSETESGGSSQAWQTNYPEVPAGQPNGANNPVWKTSSVGIPQQISGGNVVQDIIEATRKVKGKDATWFESSASEYDAFGRARAPTEHSGRHYLEWEERTRQVKLTCAAPGCVANATLLVLDARTEEHHHCRLSIGVHATDFDDEYSTEVVEWLSLNGEILQSDCNPRSSGCGNSTNRSFGELPLFPCVTEEEIPESAILAGTLNISGKLSPMVDECPVEGNLLSGMVRVTCLVRARKDSVSAQIAEAKANATNLAETNMSALLQCKRPGCFAQAKIELGEAARNKTCKLTVKLYQTDFDDSATELVELVDVDGKETRSLKPGRNPCKELALGQLNSTSTVDPFVLIDGEDVSAAITDHLSVLVTAKLSNMVDECGHDGYLLDGTARVECT